MPSIFGQSMLSFCQKAKYIYIIYIYKKLCTCFLDMPASDFRNILINTITLLDMFVCLFVLDPYPHLSRGVNSRGRTYGEAPLPPRPLVTPGPRCSSCSLSPHTYCHASCIRSVPSPVLLSYTDILPSIWSAPSLSSCPTHINNPHTYEPLKPTYKLCYLLISTALS